MNTYCDPRRQRAPAVPARGSREHRRAQTAETPGLLKRIAPLHPRVKAAIEAPADYSQSILPTLNDYPYRS